MGPNENDRCQDCNCRRRSHCVDGCAAWPDGQACGCRGFVERPKAGDVCAGCQQPITADEVGGSHTVRPGVVCHWTCGRKAMRALAAELGRAVMIRDCFHAPSMQTVFQVQERVAKLGKNITGGQTVTALRGLAACADAARQPVLAAWLLEIAEVFTSNTVGPKAGAMFRRVAPKFWQLSMRFQTDSVEATICATAHMLLAPWAKLEW